MSICIPCSDEMHKDLTSDPVSGSAGPGSAFTRDDHLSSPVNTTARHGRAANTRPRDAVRRSGG